MGILHSFISFCAATIREDIDIGIWAIRSWKSLL